MSGMYRIERQQALRHELEAAERAVAELAREARDLMLIRDRARQRLEAARDRLHKEIAHAA